MVLKGSITEVSAAVIGHWRMHALCLQKHDLKTLHYIFPSLTWLMIYLPTAWVGSNFILVTPPAVRIYSETQNSSSWFKKCFRYLLHSTPLHSRFTFAGYSTSHCFLIASGFCIYFVVLPLNAHSLFVLKLHSGSCSTEASICLFLLKSVNFRWPLAIKLWTHRFLINQRLYSNAQSAQLADCNYIQTKVLHTRD